MAYRDRAAVRRRHDDPRARHRRRRGAAGQLCRAHLLAVLPPRSRLAEIAEAALSLSKARAIAATAPGNHLVFAPAKFVSRELLARERIAVEYAPLPFALYRLETA